MSFHNPPNRWEAKLSCTNRSCKERARIRAGRFFKVRTNGPHGAVLDVPAYACRHCGFVNKVPAALLPREIYQNLKDRRGHMADLARSTAYRHLRPSPADWIVGPRAKEMLTDALIRTDKLGAYCALIEQDEQITEVPIDLRGLSKARAVEALDRINCTVLTSVHIATNGHQKAVVFHCQAGACLP